MQCHAKSKRSGKQCKRSAVPGMSVCRNHGGMTPVGAASPHFKHGRYSKHLPANLIQQYNDSRKDPDLLALRDDISLIDVRLGELVKQIPTGGASHSWVELQYKWKQMLEAQRNGNTDAARQLLGQIGTVIDEGAHETGIWEDIKDTLESRRRLTASEAKRLTDMQQVITSERAMALVFAVIDIVRTSIGVYEEEGKVADKKLLAMIGASVRSLISAKPPEKP